MLLGAGDGNFAVQTTYATGAGAAEVEIGDVNHDGILDLVVAERGNAENGTTVGIFLGNGDGTFRARVTHQTGTAPAAVELADLNGDGELDIVTTHFGGGQFANILLNNGSGTFSLSGSFATGAGPHGFEAVDLNGDDVLDLAIANRSGNSVTILLADTIRTGTAKRINLGSRDGALQALGTLEDQHQRITRELSAVGAMQSRLTVAARHLQVSVEQDSAAAQRIMDVDTAEESARLVRNRILQQAGAAVLGQANQSASLALVLLRTG